MYNSSFEQNGHSLDIGHCPFSDGLKLKEESINGLSLQMQLLIIRTRLFGNGGVFGQNHLIINVIEPVKALTVRFMLELRVHEIHEEVTRVGVFWTNEAL